jgi:hypothetical protein
LKMQLACPRRFPTRRQSGSASSKRARARSRDGRASACGQRARDRRGEANCLKNLAFTAFSRNDRDAVKGFFRDALEIYQEISELYSVGMTHQALAQLASEVDDRNSHIIAAKTAWEAINRDDLINQLRTQFPNGPEI